MSAANFHQLERFVRHVSDLVRKFHRQIALPIFVDEFYISLPG